MATVVILGAWHDGQRPSQYHLPTTAMRFRLVGTHLDEEHCFSPSARIVFHPRLKTAPPAIGGTVCPATNWVKPLRGGGTWWSWESTPRGFGLGRRKKLAPGPAHGCPGRDVDERHTGEMEPSSRSCRRRFRNRLLSEHCGPISTIRGPVDRGGISGAPRKPAWVLTCPEEPLFRSVWPACLRTDYYHVRAQTPTWLAWRFWRRFQETCFHSE